MAPSVVVENAIWVVEVVVGVAFAGGVSPTGVPVSRTSLQLDMTRSENEIHCYFIITHIDTTALDTNTNRTTLGLYTETKNTWNM